MTLRVTVDIYSGRPNPTIELDDRQSADLLDRLAPDRRLDDTEAVPPTEPVLGYRGVEIEQIGDADAALPRTFRLAGGQVHGRGLAHATRDAAVEEWLLGGDGPLRDRLDVDTEFFDLADAGRLSLAEKFSPVLLDPHIHVLFPAPCACSPLYEPAWWNVPGRQPYNNCYNYATNYRTNTFAQPGKAAGAQYTQLTSASVRPAALADELIDGGTATSSTCPAEGHLVALVIWPGSDYHWYRRGRNGWWSHKPGGTAVTNVDNSNHAITNPETADRGGYTEFAGYFVVMHGHVMIK